jgi:hypothetical protein
MSDTASDPILTVTIRIYAASDQGGTCTVSLKGSGTSASMDQLLQAAGALLGLAEKYGGSREDFLAVLSGSKTRISTQQ